MQIEKKIQNHIIKQIKVLHFDFKNKNRYDKIVVQFDGFFLEISVDVDTDEIILNILSEYEENDSLEVPDWASKIIGQKVVACWKAINDQGYFDLFILGAKEFRPNVIIYCIASQLLVNC